jgi:Flp pilus assembly pilin Flp
MVLGVHEDGIAGAAYAHIAVIAPVVLPSYLLVLKRALGVRFMALGKAVLPALLGSAAAALAARAAASQLASPLAQLAAGLTAGGVVYVILAGQQLVTVFGRGRAAERMLHGYGSAARLLGLPVTGRAKHGVRRTVTRTVAPSEPGSGG